eukprot:NODE_11452_length_305_cov_23.230469_g10539_i0.p2 GENE.NODE_11452_length_305_cov_23.230469_g10539_i0~~NODE_11452_length_305_cov_23.230469_g10539_i0.p2  ORF type:complete len:74 (-),score=17.07 NODE_11452_length_305_cov_23.230469_g10539_i0:84-278(-)
MGGQVVCSGCQKRVNFCSVCCEQVQGLIAWSSVCGHAGHLHHMQEWFAQSNQCPKCGVHAHLRL